MSRCLYNSSFEKFINADENSIFGALCDNYHGDALTTTREAWKSEISIIKGVLANYADKNGQVIFEYDIPRLGKRIDVVLLLGGIIFCIEFKVGESKILEADVDQVLDYALDLKNFHKFSQDNLVVPILVATNYRSSSTEIKMSVYDDRVVNPLVTGASGLANLVSEVLKRFPEEPAVNPNWIISPYAPTPTIIEAAKALYENHSVENITRHEADKVTTDRTIAYILDVIQKSKENQQKSICFVTGVPGAGKTLVGLDVAIKQTYQGNDKPVEDEGAVYLSGNGPLVAVLTEALAQDNYKKCRENGEKKKMTDSRREVSKSIQIIHRYRDNMLAKIKNPVENGVLEIDPEKAVKMEKAGFGEVEHVAIFDEAQRSWTHKRIADYLKRGGTYGNKLKVPNFPVSEAAFLIWSLDQREDWATIVCLVGGGQESGLISGTEPMPAICAFGEAVNDIGNVERNYHNVQCVRDYFIDKISTIDNVYVNSPEDALPYIINISVEGVPSQVMLNSLSSMGIYVSAGSACSKGHRSNVLTAMGVPPKSIDSAIRISLSKFTTENDMEILYNGIKETVNRVRR